MGYELRRWLADRLPSGLSSGERLVALELADQANDQTRKAYGTDLLAILARRCGMADANQIGKILTKLSGNGVELRLPIRGQGGQIVTDKRGRTMFACKGHQSTFRIPLVSECPALKLTSPGDLQSSPAEVSFDPDGAEPQVQSSPAEDDSAHEAHPGEAQSSPAGTQSSPAEASKLTPAGDPSPQSPHNSSSLSSAPPGAAASATEKGEREDLIEDERQEPVREVDQFAARLMAEYSATADEVAAVLAGAKQDKIRSLPAWAGSETGKADIARRLTEHRARAAFAADRVARRSSCGHSDIKDPEPPEGWGDCLSCNIARKRTAKASTPMAEPQQDRDPADVAALALAAEMIAKSRANRELRERQKSARTGRNHEPPRLDEAAEALREEWLTSEGVPPIRAVEMEERHTA